MCVNIQPQKLIIFEFINKANPKNYYDTLGMSVNIQQHKLIILVFIKKESIVAQGYLETNANMLQQQLEILDFL